MTLVVSERCSLIKKHTTRISLPRQKHASANVLDHVPPRVRVQRQHRPVEHRQRDDHVAVGAIQRHRSNAFDDDQQYARAASRASDEDDHAEACDGPQRNDVHAAWFGRYSGRMGRCRCTFLSIAAACEVCSAYSADSACDTQWWRCHAKLVRHPRYRLTCVHAHSNRLTCAHAHSTLLASQLASARTRGAHSPRHVAAWRV